MSISETTRSSGKKLNWSKYLGDKAIVYGNTPITYENKNKSESTLSQVSRYPIELSKNRFEYAIPAAHDVSGSDGETSFPTVPYKSKNLTKNLKKPTISKANSENSGSNGETAFPMEVFPPKPKILRKYCGKPMIPEELSRKSSSQNKKVDSKVLPKNPTGVQLTNFLDGLKKSAFEAEKLTRTNASKIKPSTSKAIPAVNKDSKLSKNCATRPIRNLEEFTKKILKTFKATGTVINSTPIELSDDDEDSEKKIPEKKIARETEGFGIDLLRSPFDSDEFERESNTPKGKVLYST